MEQIDKPKGEAMEITRGINLAVTVGGFALTLATMIGGGAWGYATLNSDNRQALSRIAALEEKTKPLDTYMFRQGQVEASLTETNVRISRIVESFNGKVDTVLIGISSLKDDVAGVKSDVRLLSQKVETRPQRTNFTPP